jgi:ribosomal protein S11
MKIYQNSYRDEGQEHQGYSYHQSKREALKVARKHGCGEVTTEVIEVQPSKAGIIRALRIYGGHPDNG